MPKYLSGRSKKLPGDQLSDDRYKYLDVSQAEPNPGYPEASNVSDGTTGPVIPEVSATIPGGRKYQVISIYGDDDPGKRYWHPVSGGVIPGAVTFYKDNSQVSGTNSITQLDWYGIGVTFGSELSGADSTDIRAKIYLAPPGNAGELLFNESNSDYFGSGLARTDFSTSSKLIFNSTTGILTVSSGLNIGTTVAGVGGSIFSVNTDNSGGIYTTLVGIGTTNPGQNLDLIGNLQISGIVYDSDKSAGSGGDLLVNVGGTKLQWKTPNQVQAGAGGDTSEIQYHGSTGLVEGADSFVWDTTNSRVGIGSTQPEVLLDVRGGISTFKGGVGIDTLEVSSDVSIGGSIYVTGISTFVGITSLGSDVSIGGSIYVTGISTFVGITSLGSDVSIVGFTTIDDNAWISGITTIGNIKLSGNKIESLTGDLTFESNTTVVRIDDSVLINNDTQSTASSNGSLEVRGGVGIYKNLNVGGGVSIDGYTTSENTFEYKFITGTEPTAEQVYFDQGNYTTTNQIKIHKTDDDSGDNSTLLASLREGDNIKIINESDTTKTITYKITGNPTVGGTGADEGLVYVIPISYLSGTWTTVSNLHEIDVTITQKGEGSVTLAAAGGITTTGGDLYIGGDLFVNDDIFLDEARVQSLIVNSGVATFHGDVYALSDVGIGTTNPASGSKLHLHDSTACRLQLTTDSTGQGTDDGVRLMIDTSDNFEILQREDANIEFFTHDVQRVTINGDGDVGIGTTNPETLLDVYGDGANGEITAQRKDGASILIQAQASLGRFGTNSNDDLQLMTNSDGKITIKTGGNVGIGTNTPGQKLDVVGSIRSTVKPWDYSTNQYSATLTAREDATHTLELTVNQNNSTASEVLGTYQTGGTSSTNINAENGWNVGIGTTNPETKLTVKAGDVSTNIWLGIAAAANNAGNQPSSDLNGTTSGIATFSYTSSFSGATGLTTTTGITTTTTNAIFTVITNAGGNGIESMVCTTPGSGYAVDEVLTINANQLAGSSSGSITVTVKSTTKGGIGAKASVYVPTTSNRTGVIVRNISHYRALDDNESGFFWVDDAGDYTSTTDTYAYRAAASLGSLNTEPQILENTFWVTGKGKGYFASDVGIGTNKISEYGMQVIIDGRLGLTGAGNTTNPESPNDVGMNFFRSPTDTVGYIGIGTYALDHGESDDFSFVGKGNLLFGNHDVSWKERLRITSAGDVGIGTTNPTGTDALTGNTTTLAVGNIKAGTVTGNLTGPGNNKEILFKNGAVVGAASILNWDTSTESLGIGTDDPVTRLHVANLSNTDTGFTTSITLEAHRTDIVLGQQNGAAIRFYNHDNSPNTNEGYFISHNPYRYLSTDYVDGNESQREKTLDFTFKQTSNGTLKTTATIKGEKGYLGIGVTEPEAILHTHGVDNLYGFLGGEGVQADGGTHHRRIKFYTDNYYTAIQGQEAYSGGDGSGEYWDIHPTSYYDQNPLVLQPAGDRIVSISNFTYSDQGNFLPTAGIATSWLSATGGTGTDAKFKVVVDDGMATVSLSGIGTLSGQTINRGEGYSVGDLLTVVGDGNVLGNSSKTITFKVTSVAGGNLGIGTNNPSNTIHVLGSYPQVKIQDRINGNNVQLGVDGDKDNFNIDWVSSTNKNINFINTGSGNIRVGIATTNVQIADAAADRLVLYDHTLGNNGLTIFSGTTNTGNIYFGDGITGTANKMGTITYSHDENYMRFSTNGNVEKLRIDEDGNIGIGTTNPVASNIADALNTTGIKEKVLAVGIVTANKLYGNIVGGINADGNVTITGTLDVDEHTDLDGLEVVGHTELDSVNVSGLSTFNDTVNVLGIVTTKNSTNLDSGKDNEQNLLILNGTVSNNSLLYFKNVRIQDGTDWYSSAFRIQKRIDNTEMGYIQFGTGDGGGAQLGGYDIIFGSPTTNRENILHIVGHEGHVGIATTNPVASNIADALNTIGIKERVLAVGIVTANEYYGTWKGTAIADNEIASDFLKAVIDDTSPQLGGNLDLNSNDIDGTGNINITGNITATGTLGINTDKISEYGVQVIIDGRLGLTGTSNADDNGDVGLSFFRAKDDQEGYIGIGSFAASNGESSNDDFGITSKGNLLFDTYDTSSASWKERLRITSAGDVGIGTTNPIGTDAVGDDNTATLAVGILTARQIYGPVTGTINTTGDVDINGVLTVNKDQTDIYASTTQITPFLTVKNTSKTDESYGGIRLQSKNNSESAEAVFNIACVSSSTDYESNLVFQSRTGAASWVERLRIDSDGNIGINSSDPQVKLDVVSTSVSRTWTPAASAVAMFERNGVNRIGIVGTTKCQLDFGDSDSDNPGYIRYDHADDSMSVRVNGGGIKLHLDSSGDVGIGTTNPTGTDALTGNTTTLAVGIVTANTVYATNINVSPISGGGSGTGTLEKGSGSFSGTSIEVLDTYPSNLYTSVEYILLFTASNGDIQSQKVLIMNNSANVYHNEYSIMYSNDKFMDVTVQYSGANINLRASKSSGGDWDYSWARILV